MKLLIFLFIPFLLLAQPQGKVRVQDLDKELKATHTRVAGDPTLTGLDSVGTYQGLKNLKVYNVLDYGAAGDGVTDDYVAIQETIDSCVSGGVVFFPPGTYLISDTLKLKSNIVFSGVDKYNTKIYSNTSNRMRLQLYLNSISHIIIEKLSFEASTYYPNSTITSVDSVLASTDSLIRAIQITNSSNIKIQDCYFYGLTYGSIDARGAINNIQIDKCIFNNASYAWKVILFAGNYGGLADFHYNNDDAHTISFINNTIMKFGPDKIFYPGTDDGVASMDAIHFDKVRNSIISGNQIDSCAGNAIRVEESRFINVSNNIISHPAENGINIYGYTFDCNVSSNIIFSWGRLPNQKYIRFNSDRDSIFMTKVYMDSLSTTSYLDVVASIPNLDSGVVEFPYEILGDTSFIPTFSPDVTGWNPFRGYSAIAAASKCLRNSITGNVCYGDTTTSSTGYSYNENKYTHASDYGISIGVHSINALPNNNDGYAVISGNIVKNVINSTKEIFVPKYSDSLGTIDYKNSSNYQSTVFSNEATVWDGFKNITFSNYAQTRNDITDHEEKTSAHGEDLTRVSLLWAAGGHPPYIFCDTFDRTDRDTLGVPNFSLSGNAWITHSGLDTLVISNNLCKRNVGAGTSARSSYIIDSTSYDWSIKANNLDTSRVRLFYRYNNSTNYIHFNTDSSGGCAINMFEASADSNIARSYNTGFTSGGGYDIIRLTAQDSTYTAYLNGTLIFTATTSFLSTCDTIAIQIYDPDVRLNDMTIKKVD